MRFVLLLIGLAILAWIVMTQLNTAKVIAVEGAPQGTPHQLLDQTKARMDQINKDAQKRADQANGGVVPDP